MGSSRERGVVYVTQSIYTGGNFQRGVALHRLYLSDKDTLSEPSSTSYSAWMDVQCCCSERASFHAHEGIIPIPPPPMSTFLPMAMIYSLHLNDLIILDIMIDMRQAVIFDVERDASFLSFKKQHNPQKIAGETNLEAHDACILQSCERVLLRAWLHSRLPRIGEMAHVGSKQGISAFAARSWYCVRVSILRMLHMNRRILPYESYCICVLRRKPACPQPTTEKGKGSMHTHTHTHARAHTCARV